MASGGPRPDDEDDLVERARRGDRSAYADLFRAHRDRVHGLAVRLTGDAELAEDVVLDTFTAAWVGLPDFRGDSRFSTWVCSIALNHVRQGLRSRDRRRARFEPLARLSGPHPSEEPPDVEEAVDLERAIAALPPGAREALLLRHVYGLSCAETAAAMRVTTGTVKSQTARACALLKESLSYE